MEENIYIAKTVAEPIFYVGSSKDKRQLVTKIMLFSNKKDAHDWVKKRKNKYRILSSSVRILHKKHIKGYRLSSNRMLNITLEQTGGIMNDFRPLMEIFSVHYMNKKTGLWSFSLVSDEVINKYSLKVRD